jgi:hypothetical protein
MAAGALAWDESSRVCTCVPQVRQPATQIDLVLPARVILAGVKTPDNVKVTQRSGMNELSVTAPDGTNSKGC